MNPRESSQQDAAPTAQGSESAHDGHTVAVSGPQPLNIFERSYERDLDEAVARHKRERTNESYGHLLDRALRFAMVIRR